MRLTRTSAGRAVRMYAPMQVAASGGPNSSAVSSPGDKDVPSNEVCAARRITEVILRARASRKSSQQSRLSPPKPVPPLAKAQTQNPCSPISHVGEVTTAVVAGAVDGQTAAQLALSFGKSAFMTHLVHQHKDVCGHHGAFSASELDYMMVDEAGESHAAAPTASLNTRAVVTPRRVTPQIPRAAEAQGLQMEVKKSWDGLTDEARVRWITSTPQGRRALRYATNPQKYMGVMPARVGGRPSALHMTSSLEAMLSKYEDTLVQPRLPRAAALASPPRESLLRMGLRDGTRTSQDFLSNLTTVPCTFGGMLSRAYANNASCRHLRDRSDAVRREERRKLWQQAVVQLLGGEAAFMFLRDVKDLQQPRKKGGDTPIQEADIQASGASRRADTATITDRDATGEGMAGDDAAGAFSDGLLSLCESLGIGSPRRAYVLARVLPKVDAATATGAPAPSLADVRDLAKRCAAEYDQLRNDAAQTARETGFASAQDAVHAFEREKLELAVADVQAKLSSFRKNLPHLKNCVRVLSK